MATLCDFIQRLLWLLRGGQIHHNRWPIWVIIGWPLSIIIGGHFGSEYALGAQINEAPRWFQLLSVEYIHPAQGFSLAYLTQVHLCGLEILVAQQHFRDDLERNPVPTGVGSRVPPPNLWPQTG